ncbi:hypothetical protein ACJX0J_027433, partial [Zea mays]
MSTCITTIPLPHVCMHVSTHGGDHQSSSATLLAGCHVCTWRTAAVHPQKKNHFNKDSIYLETSNFYIWYAHVILEAAMETFFLLHYQGEYVACLVVVFNMMLDLFGNLLIEFVMWRWVTALYLCLTDKSRWELRIVELRTGKPSLDLPKIFGFHLFLAG